MLGSVLISDLNNFVFRRISTFLVELLTNIRGSLNAKDSERIIIQTEASNIRVLILFVVNPYTKLLKLIYMLRKFKFENAR